jgi:uncharacterized protein YgiM (DUF1202 family)
MVALLTLGLPGCAGGGAGNMFGGASYTISADDACANQRQTMKSFQDYFYASMIQGAAVGAVAGGLAGYAIGGNATGALVGAGTGAVIGGVGGYYSAKQKANGDPSALTLSVYQDVSTENSKIDAVSAAFMQLRDCRLRSASAVKADFAAKKISREDAQARLLKTKQLFLEDVTYAEGLGSKMASRAGEYDNASAQIMQTNPSAQQTLARRDAASPRAAGGPSLVANEAARVRAEASTSGAQVASLSPGESVTSLGDAPADWAHVRLKDGKTGYVASRLLRPAGTRAPTTASAPPPKDAAGVAQLTETNQLKRKSLDDEVAQAKSDANGSSFELSGSISRLDWRAAG